MERRISTLTLLCLAVVSGVGALKVNIPQDEYEFARGDNITLPCKFESKFASPELIIITWSAEELEDSTAETTILTYFFPSGTTNIKQRYEGRVSIDKDIPTGKVNLKLSSITLADNKIFECRVLIPGDDEGQPADRANLVVLVAPSTPVCAIQGKAEYGQNINLTCVSEEGSPAPTYKWENRDVKNMPRANAPRTTDKGGIMSLYNITKDTSGYYTCTSRNKIRSATCNITLSVMPPSMNIGSTAGIIGGVVAGLIILIIVIYCCCCRRKKNKDEEYAMGVHEEEFHDKESARNGESRYADGEETMRSDRDESPVRNPGDRRKDYDDRRSDYDDRRSDYNDRRSDYDDRRSDYNDRRSDYDDRRSDYNDRRSDYDDRRSDYGDRRDRHERYDDDRHYDDDRRRDRRYDDDRYDEPYDDRNHDRPPVPANKPPRRDNDA